MDRSEFLKEKLCNIAEMLEEVRREIYQATPCDDEDKKFTDDTLFALQSQIRNVGDIVEYSNIEGEDIPDGKRNAMVSFEVDVEKSKKMLSVAGFFDVVTSGSEQDIVRSIMKLSDTYCADATDIVYKGRPIDVNK